MAFGLLFVDQSSNSSSIVQLMVSYDRAQHRSILEIRVAVAGATLWATKFAAGMGLEVAAGHGLTHHNLPLLVASAHEIVEYNIGHSIVSEQYLSA